MNLCPHNGSLVGAAGWFPVEPFDYDWGTSDPAIGCNRLRCRHCNSNVLSRLVAVLASTETPTLDPKVVYDTADWSTLGALLEAPDARTRLYVCRCNYRFESQVMDLKAFLLDYRGAFESDWECAGHPPLDVSCRLDGVAIGEETNFDRVAHAALAQPLPLLPRGMARGITKEPAFWLVRLYRLLSTSNAPHLARKLGDAVGYLVENQDPALRRGALGFFISARDAPGGERIAMAVKHQRSLFAGVPDPSDPKSNLEDYLIEALERRLRFCGGGDTSDRRDIEVAREEVLRGRGLSLLYALGDVDGEWLCANAATIAQAAPALVSSLVGALKASPVDRAAAAIAEVARVSKAK